MDNRRLVNLFLAGFVFVASPARAQTTAPAESPPASSPASQPAAPATTQPATELAEVGVVAKSAEEIQAWISRIESSADLTEAARAEAVQALRQTLDLTASIQTHESRRADYEKRRLAAPDELKRLRDMLSGASSRPTTQPAIEVSEDDTLEDLERRLEEAEANAKDKSDKLRVLDEELKRREERLNSIPGLILEFTRRREADAAALAGASPADMPPSVWEARKQMLHARRDALAAEIRELEEEKRLYEARRDIIGVQRELLRYEQLSADAIVAALQHIVSDRRRQELERQQKEADVRLEEAPSAVRDLIRRNQRYIKQRTDVFNKLEEIANQTALAEGRLKQLEQDLKFIQAMGLTQDAEIVEFLIRKRQEVADLRRFEQDIRQHERERAYNELQLSKLDDEIAKYANLDRKVEEHVRTLKDADIPNPDRFEPDVRTTLEERVKTFNQLRDDRRKLRTRLSELLILEEQVVMKVGELAEIIEKNILWLPSAQPLYQQTPPARLDDMLNRLFALPGLLLLDLQRRWPVYLVVCLLVPVLVVAQWRLARYIRDVAQKASRVLTDSYRYTLGALLATLALTLPAPLLLLFFSWRLSALGKHVEAGGSGVNKALELASALSAGFVASAVVLLSLTLLKHVCRARGLAEVHFRWPPSTVRGLRIHLSWFAPIAVICTFVVAATGEFSEFAYRNSVGRMAFLVAMMALAALLWRLLNPSSGIFAQRYTESSSGWLYRLRYVWLVGAVLAPVSLALASFFGYHFTATIIVKRLDVTLWLVLGIILLESMFVRWLVLAQRRLAIEQAEKRRAAEAARREEEARKREEAQEAAEAGASAPEPPPPVPAIDEGQINLVDIGEQTRRLVRIFVYTVFFLGFYFIWEPLMPALSVLADVKISSYTVEVPGDAGGPVRSEIRYINLGHVVVALFILTITFVATSNIPGLLEIVLLSRLPLDTGSKFAVKTIARYIITTVGVVLACSAVGVGWGQVQWLVAAVSVGLGFGLQEIFANFISGLIILFERPIRVGDIVTIGNVSGNVTRIRIRATTIMDWDRKELIIPNKEFITGQVINWNLTDPTMRVVIPVGIAYGSDTRLAQKLLIDVARAHPRVLKDPAPDAPFLSFGESTLNFELRVFVEQPSHSIPTRNDLHFAIDDAFRKAGIEISFHQRDIHLRSLPPEVEALLRDRVLGPNRSRAD